MEFNKKGEQWIYRRCKWDSVSNSLLNIFREDSFCDQSGKDTLTIGYKWMEGINDWIPQEKVNYQFDVQGRRTLFAKFGWHNSSQQWRGIEKLENAFDEWGNLTQYAYYNGCNDITKSWIGSFKEKNLFDENSNCINRALYNWNTATRTWVGNYKIESDFDERGNILSQILSVWNLLEVEWKYRIKQENGFDENGIQQSIAEYFWDPKYNKWIEDFKYEINQKNEFSYVRVSYSWNIKDEIGKPTQNFLQNGIQRELTVCMSMVYPNPANYQFNVQFTGNNFERKIYLFSAKGIKVNEEPATEDQMLISIDNLPSGIYFLLIETNGNKYSQKVIITNDQY